MTSGKNHDRIGLTASAVIGGAGLYFSQSAFPIFLAAGCAVGTLYFSPDLDVASKPLKRWGLLGIFWVPYTKTVKHRSAISHSPVVGTLGRLGYLLGVVIALWLLGLALKLLRPPNWGGAVGTALWLASHWPALLGLLLGLELAALLHLAGDRILFKGKGKGKGKGSKPRRRR